MRDALPAPVLHGERVRVRGSHMCEAVLITAERSAHFAGGKTEAPFPSSCEEAPALTSTFPLPLAGRG